jgi:uncharacterized protein (DUF58 family)
MTSRLWVAGLLIYGLLFLGLVTLDGGPVALVIPLLIYLAFNFLDHPHELRLKADRVLSHDSLPVGSQATVRTTVTNQGVLLEEVLLEDLLPEGVILVSGENRLLAALLPGCEASLEYIVQVGRGSYTFTGVRVTASDPAGLLQRSELIAERSHLLGLPHITLLRSVSIRPRRTLAFTGPIPARRGGPGVSFLGVREYRHGDPLRRINWRLTARHMWRFHTDQLYANEFEQERIADVGIILDARQQTDVVRPPDVLRPGDALRLPASVALFEYSVQAAASLAAAFLRDGHRVGLLVYGRGREATFPGYGKVQRQRILKALARARTGENQALERLSYLPTRFFPARSQIVLVSPLIPDDLAVLTRLRGWGYQVMVISPDPVSFEEQTSRPVAVSGDGRRPSQAGAAAYGRRIARVERTLMLRRMQRAGIRVVDWHVDQSLDQVMYAALGRNTGQFPP